jgi:hypothetical protein
VRGAEQTPAKRRAHSPAAREFMPVARALLPSGGD